MYEQDNVMESGAIVGGEEQNLGISADLIRGHINTIILRCLYDEDKYGYDIINEIEKKSGGMYTIKQPTLYSALKRLESLKYVESYYGDVSNGGRRKYFSLTDLGKSITEQNLSEWEYSRTIIDSLISDGEAHYDFSFITDKQNELTELKRSLALREQALEDEKSALNGLRNELQRERSLLSAQSASLTSQKSDFNDLRDKIQTQASELAEKERALSEKQGVIDAKEIELQEKERQIDETKALLEAKSEEIASLRKENDALIKQSEELCLSQANAEELATAKSELEEKKSVILSLQSAIATQESTIAFLKNDLDNKSGEFYSKQLELRAQQAQLDAQREKLETEKRQMEAQLKEADTLKATILERETEYERAKQAWETEKLALSQTNGSVEEERRLLEEERANLQNQLQTLEVERATLRADNDVLETTKLALEEEKAKLDALRVALKEERESLDKKTYELTQEEYQLTEKRRSVESKQSEVSVTSEETKRRIDDLENRENELLRNTRKLQDDLAVYTQQQKEFSARQSAYNQQQLEFIARKNALASQQFELADKMATYNAQAKTLNENIERIESERLALQAEKTRFEEEKTRFEEQRTETEKNLSSLRERLSSDDSGIRVRLSELAEREHTLSQREAMLNEKLHEFNTRVINTYESPTYSPTYGGYNDVPYGAPSLRETAMQDGIKLNMAGNIRPSGLNKPDAQSTKRKATYNVGATLLKAALVMFCIVAFESILVFFGLDYLQISPIYPILGFSVGFVVFMTCTILYTLRFRPHAKFKKHPSYLITTAIVFVIGVILITMIAVYLNAELAVPSELLSYVIVPTVYLLNLPIFVIFFYAFARRSKR